jgi:hypothetical protein
MLADRDFSRDNGVKSARTNKKAHFWPTCVKFWSDGDLFRRIRHFERCISRAEAQGPLLDPIVELLKRKPGAVGESVQRSHSA